jgi:uncharacterized GH25 family protein
MSKSGRGWPIAIVVILALSVSANVGVMLLVQDDPSFAVEPDYYRKAVAWDGEMAQQARNDSTGWRLESQVGAMTGAGAPVRVRLVDSQGQPITGATVRMDALYNARAGEIHGALLVADADGYVATIPAAHAGAWELRFDVQWQGTRFTRVHRVDVRAGPPA